MWNHGGNIYSAARLSGYDGDKILDFSANINPLGLPRSARETIVNNLDKVVNYPEPGNPMLVSAIASYLGLNKEHIICGNGATEIIYLTIRAVNPHKALILAPSFSEYSRALNIINCDIEYFSLREETGFTLDTGGLLSTLPNGYQMLILCNPNNPTGTIINGFDMKRILEKCRKLGIYMLVDEAFMDFVEEQHKFSLSKSIAEYQNLVVVRAFTKFFGFPGLRLGYGLVGSNRLKLIMENIKEPWSVNILAEKAGVAALGDREYIGRTKEWLDKEREYLYESLKDIKGLKPFRSHTNFILVKILHSSLDAGILQRLMIDRGIFIRNAENFYGLNNRFIRIAVKNRQANKCFLQALQEIMQSEEHFNES